MRPPVELLADPMPGRLPTCANAWPASRPPNTTAMAAISVALTFLLIPTPFTSTNGLRTHLRDQDTVPVKPGSSRGGELPGVQQLEPVLVGGPSAVAPTVVEDSRHPEDPEHENRDSGSRSRTTLGGAGHPSEE